MEKNTIIALLKLIKQNLKYKSEEARPLQK